MRATCFILGLLFLAGRLAAQSPNNDQIPEDAAFDVAFSHRALPVVQGKISHLSPAEIRQLQVTYTLVTPFAAFQSKRTATLADDGSFTLSLDYALPYQQIWLQVGELFYTGIYANNDLRVELDAEKLRTVKDGVSFYGEGVSYTGTDGPLNTYLSQQIARRTPEQQRLSMRRQTLVMQTGPHGVPAVAEFMRLTDSLDAIESAYIAANPSPYSAILRNEDQSECYSQLIVAYWNKKMPDSLWSRVNRHKPWCISNDGSLFYSYLARYIQYCDGPSRSSAKLTLQRIDSLYPPAKADFLKLRLGSQVDADSQRTALHLIVANIHTPWCATVAGAEMRRADQNITEINKALAASKATGDSTALGRPLFIAPFGAILYKADPGPATDLLTRIGQAFPGKAILIDRWATWCGPCIGEMSHGKELQKNAAGVPVVFVYLCTIHGSSEEKWKTEVFNLQQPGIHILIDEKQDAEISKYFSFSGYPGHALIGLDGKYKPGAITWMSEIADRKALETLIAR